MRRALTLVVRLSALGVAVALARPAAVVVIPVTSPIKPRWPLWIAALGVVGATAAVAAWLLSAPRPAFDESDAARFENGDVGRGRLVFHAADCGSCHATPGQEDPLHLGGGMALTGPPGVFRPPNISTHRRDGIGAWRGWEIANAVMTGVSPDGRHYFPALPYTSYAGMMVGDVADLVAYLRTLPAVEGRPPPHHLAFPLNIRRSVGLWKLLFFNPAPVPAEPRGRYLADAMGHCAECHSTRNLMGAIQERTRYAGGPDPEGTGFVPNITPTRLAGWSREALVTFLTTGIAPDGRRAGGSMADVVRNLAELPLSDREAIVDHIRALPPRPTPDP